MIEDTQHPLSGVLYEGRENQFGESVEDGEPSAFMSIWAIAQTLQKTKMKDDFSVVESV